MPPARTLLQRLFSRGPQPLTGVPPVRRQKTYSAQSGYVYQYYYSGHRPFASSRLNGTEYVFEVSADRKTYTPVSVLLGDECVRSWEAGHSRTLNSTEQYAIAKMALFQAFDERANPQLLQQEIHVRPADVDGILNTLDLD